MLLVLAGVALLHAVGCGPRATVEGSGEEETKRVRGSDVQSQLEAFADATGAELERSRKQFHLVVPSDTLFVFDSAMLRVESEPYIRHLALALAAKPRAHIAIEAHTDGSGDEPYERTLTERRAQSLHNFLTENGIDSGRIETIGYGSSRPVAPNDTAAGRYRNRRIVMTIR